MSRQEKQIRAELYIQLKHGYPKLAFHALREDREAIDEEFGQPLNWEELPGKQAVRIAVYRDNTDVDDRNTWDSQHQWLLDKIEKLQSVFRDRVAALDFDALQEAYAPEEVEPE